MEESKRGGTPHRALSSPVAWQLSAVMLNAARRLQEGEIVPLIRL